MLERMQYWLWRKLISYTDAVSPHDLPEIKKCKGLDDSTDFTLLTVSCISFFDTFLLWVYKNRFIMKSGYVVNAVDFEQKNYI